MNKLIFSFCANVILQICMHVGIAVAAEDPYANQAPVPDSTSEFFESVQRAIRHDDAFGLANVVRYPLHVCRYKKLIPIRSKKEFVQNYRVIMNDITRETLLNQDPRKLLRNWEGVAADGGRMWLEEAGEWRDGEVRPVIVSMYNGPLPYLPQHPCLPWRKQGAYVMEVHVSQRNAATLLLTAGAVAMLDYAGVNGKHSEGLFARRERELDFFITGIGYDSKGQRINP